MAAETARCEMTTLDTRQDCASGPRSWVKVDGKGIGWIEGITFYKPVRGSKHMLRYPPAWAIQADAYQQIIHRVSTIVILDDETDTAYRISTSDFERFKNKLDRGHGPQYYVELERWTTEEGSGHGR
jgi:hypothetical protein